MDVESSRQQGPKGDANSNSMAAASEVSVDWRGRPCRPQRHGGMKAAVFVLGVHPSIHAFVFFLLDSSWIQAFEIMAIAAVGNNLITYVFNEMHFPLSKSANIVTNFIGTMFLLSLLGGFLSDSYLGSFWTMLIFGFVELSGFYWRAPPRRPPACDMKAAGQCEEVAGVKAGIFFAALYLVALGSGCLKPNIIAHGADQFRRDGEDQAVDGGKRLSSYFNAAYFSFCVGEMVALTVLVWVQTRSGMDVGFGVSAAAMAVGLVSLVAGVVFYRNKPPQGSICTPIAKVFVAAVAERKQVCPSSRATLQGISSTGAHEMRLNTTNICRINKFRFLDKACVKAQDGGSKESGWGLCTAAEVEQFLVFGLSEMFTAVGLIEFFYKQSLSGMQAFLTSMTYCSYSFGFYLSSVLVSLVNRVTSRNGGNGWLSNNDLDKDRLDLFYWLLAALSILNFFNFLFWSRWYSNSVETVQVAGVGGDGGSEQEDEKGSA
uniref:Peptide transporter PTR1 n=1 Tax=Aegilops tauschii TaxID=37682 RepID=M8C0X5_AEGTA